MDKKLGSSNLTYNLELIATIFLIVIICFVFFYGGYIIQKALSIDETPDFPKDPYIYSFYVVSNDSLLSPLNLAYIRQDFSNNIGEFSFVLMGSKKLDYIMMTFPSNIESNSINCQIQSYSDYLNSFINKEFEKPKEFPCIIKQMANSSVIIGFGGLTFQDVRLLVKYNLVLTPNNEYQILTRGSKWYDEGLSGNFILNFGKNYECLSECLFDLHNTKVSQEYSTITEKHLIFTEDIPNSWNQFKVLTKSKNLLDNKNFDLSLGVSLVSGSVFSFISLMIYLFQIFVKKRENKISALNAQETEDKILNRIKTTLYNQKKEVQKEITLKRARSKNIRRRARYKVRKK